MISLSGTPPCSLQMLYIRHVCFVADNPKKRWQVPKQICHRCHSPAHLVTAFCSNKHASNTLSLNDIKSQLIMLHIKELTLSSGLCMYMTTTQVHSLFPYSCPSPHLEKTGTVEVKCYIFNSKFLIMFTTLTYLNENIHFTQLKTSHWYKYHCPTEFYIALAELQITCDSAKGPIVEVLSKAFTHIVSNLIDWEGSGILS